MDKGPDPWLLLVSIHIFHFFFYNDSVSFLWINNWYSKCKPSAWLTLEGRIHGDGVGDEWRIISGLWRRCQLCQQNHIINTLVSRCVHVTTQDYVTAEVVWEKSECWCLVNSSHQHLYCWLTLKIWKHNQLSGLKMSEEQTASLIILTKLPVFTS